MKKKVLIVVPSFNSGGTVTSLMNFVSSIDKEKFEIWVYAMNNVSGPNREFVAKHCHVIGYSSSAKTQPFSFKRRMIRMAYLFVRFTKNKLLKYGFNITPLVFKKVAKNLDRGNYDFVIAFQEGLPTRLVRYFNHGTKIAWVRAEYGRYLAMSHLKPEVAIYEKFDKIVNVSKSAAKNFISHMPMFKEKTFVIYNITNPERIITMSNEKMEDLPTGSFIIVSVGRIDPVKRFSEIPRIASVLSSKGFNFKWMVIGDANVNSQSNLDEKKRIEDGVKAYHQQNNVILLGNKPNPYPYIKGSNLLVCLSSSETFNNTLTEAKILGVPVVTTDFACACESIREDVDGYISSIETIAEKIIKMMEEDTYSRIKGNLSHYKHDNSENFKTLYSSVLI